MPLCISDQIHIRLPPPLLLNGYLIFPIKCTFSCKVKVLFFLISDVTKLINLKTRLKWLFCEIHSLQECVFPALSIESLQSALLAQWFLFIPTTVVHKPCQYNPQLVFHGESSVFLFALHL